MQSFQTSLYPHSEYDLRTTPTCDQVSGKMMENENGNLFMSGEEKWQIALSKERKLLISKCSYQWTTFKGAIARAFLEEEKKEIFGEVWSEDFIFFEFTLELQRRINTLEKGPASRWWEPQWSSWGCCLPGSVRGEFILNVNQAAWAPRTFQPKRTRAPCALKDCPRMHLVPNMKRHLKKASGSWGDQRSCPTGWRKHRKAGIIKLSFPCKKTVQRIHDCSCEEHKRQWKRARGSCPGTDLPRRGSNWGSAEFTTDSALTSRLTSSRLAWLSSPCLYTHCHMIVSAGRRAVA